MAAPETQATVTAMAISWQNKRIKSPPAAPPRETRAQEAPSHVSVNAAQPRKFTGTQRPLPFLRNPLFAVWARKSAASRAALSCSNSNSEAKRHFIIRRKMDYLAFTG
jgi:hypothetical protein